MKIGVMLRCIDEKQGIGVYTQNLMDRLLQMDKQNEYVLFYRNPEFLGRYARYKNVSEKLVTAPNKLLWDQFKIPIEARRAAVDVIFNTKFSVPLWTRSKTVMVLHGSAWYVDPRSYKSLDLFYIKKMMPIYHWKAASIISVSNRAKEDMHHYIGADPGKFTTVYSAPDQRFFEEPDEAKIEAVKAKYNLPDRFILNVGSVSTAKNMKNLLRAYAAIYHKVPHKLVVAGRMRYSNTDEMELLQSNALRERVLFPGWIPQQDMPVLYRLSDVFLFPSWYESCSVALLEAMASGCAIVTSNTGGTPELMGDGALLIDPADPDAIARAVLAVLSDKTLWQKLRSKSTEQGRRFSWEKCALETLSVLKRVGQEGA